MSSESTTKPFFNSTVPIDWDIKTVGEAFEICNSLRLPISAEERGKMIGQYPYYGPTKIQGYLNEYRINGTYALIGEDGDHFLKWKELPMTLLVRGEFNVNNHAHIIRGNENLTEWFFYYFNHRELTPHLTRQGAGRYKLTKDSLSKILIPVPPLAEQRAIATCLSIWDNAIEKATHLITARELRKKWLMQQLLTGKKRLNGFSKEWQKTSLAPLSIKVKGKVCELCDDNSGLPCITAASFNGNYTNYTNDKNAIYCDESDVLILWDGENAGSASTGHVGAIGSTVAKLSLNQKLNNYYLFYLLVADNYKLREIREGSGIPHMPSDFEDWYLLNLPPLEEQIAIVNILRTADKEISLLKQKLEAYKEQKKGLMQVLLTGKVRLKV